MDWPGWTVKVAVAPKAANGAQKNPSMMVLNMTNPP
jgi:hypothetical protein